MRTWNETSPVTDTAAGAALVTAARPGNGPRGGPVVVVIAACILIALTWFGVRDAIQTHQAEARARFGAQLANAALTVEEQFRVHLLVIDQTLRLLQGEWQRDPGRFDLTRWQQDVPVLTDAALQVFIADAQGIVRASSRPSLVGQNVSQRDYFRQAMAATADPNRMIVGTAVRGAVTQQWQINLARRLERPDGAGAGIIVASYDVSNLAQIYGDLDFGPYSLVALVDTRSGAVDALANPNPARPGGSIASSPLFAAMAGAPDGHWQGLSPFDGVMRLHAFRRVGNRDLATVVAVNQDAALRGAAVWDRSARMFAGGFSVLLLLLALLLLRSDRAARERQALLADKTGQLEATLGGMSDGVMMVNSDLRLLAWNEKFSAYTGVPHASLRVGLSMEAMIRGQAEGGEFGPVDVEAEVARRMGMLRSGDITRVVERVRPSGQVIELRRNPLPGGGFVTLYSDVTARRQAEDRVREAQKMAAIGQLTAGVAHDFNNLLASIMGSAELMQRNMCDDPLQARRLAVIINGAERGASLVQQLLAFSRKHPLAPIAVDLDGVIRGMNELLRTTLGGAVRVQLQLGASWPALVDPVQIEHVILNLAINARDAMPAGGVLTITTANAAVTVTPPATRLAPGDYVTVSVNDSGTGMTQAVQRKALEPFFTTKPAGRGSGLGLSQVYGVASQSGGGVVIDSTPGLGTTVTVYLPRASASIMQAPAPVPDESAPQPMASAQGTVLLVEDEPDVRETVAGMLQSAGFASIPVADSEAALQQIDAGHAIDLLLVDLVMPGMNGIELAGAVRARFPAIPVVLMTGYSDDLRVSGERWVLGKPFTVSHLAETLQAALQDVAVSSRPFRRPDCGNPDCSNRNRSTPDWSKLPG